MGYLFFACLVGNILKTVQVVEPLPSSVRVRESIRGTRHRPHGWERRDLRQADDDGEFRKLAVEHLLHKVYSALKKSLEETVA